MRTLKYNVSELPNVIIPLGMQGERNALTVQIDLTEWADDEKENEYGVLIVMNPDGVRYGAATEYDNETHILSWQLGQADTGTYGNGAITVDFWSEGTLTRSVIARTHMLPSYYKGLDPAPDPYEVWLETMSQHSATAGAAANSAKASAEAAAQSAANAAESEDATSTLAEAVRKAVIGQAVLTEKLDISIAVSDWVQTENGYSYTIQRATITPQTFANICIDESILELTRCIEWQTAEGALTLTTERLPTDTISGYIALITTFEDGDETRQTTAEMLAQMSSTIEELPDIIHGIEVGQFRTEQFEITIGTVPPTNHAVAPVEQSEAFSWVGAAKMALGIVGYKVNSTRASVNGLYLDSVTGNEFRCNYTPINLTDANATAVKLTIYVLFLI